MDQDSFGSHYMNIDATWREPMLGHDLSRLKPYVRVLGEDEVAMFIVFYGV